MVHCNPARISSRRCSFKRKGGKNAPPVSYSLDLLSGQGKPMSSTSIRYRAVPRSTRGLKVGNVVTGVFLACSSRARDSAFERGRGPAALPPGRSCLEGKPKAASRGIITNLRLGFISMRKQFPLILFSCFPNGIRPEPRNRPYIGGLFPQARGAAPNAVRLGGGTALQANYGYRFFEGGQRPLYGEVSFPGERTARDYLSESGGGSDVATIYVDAGHSGQVCQWQGPLTIRS